MAVLSIPRSVVPAAVVAVLLLPAGLRAQSFRLAETEFNARRTLSVPTDKSWAVVITEFLHHGQVNPEGSNLVVCGRNRELVPSRVLQLGPGDFCRLALQTVKGQDTYEIFYGGDPPKQAPPAWTNRDGLLLETRHYKPCDLGSLEAVRKAFDSSTPLGSDYVEEVSHSRNPFSLKFLPFLSHYSGYLHVPSTGTYGFMTSSQDASFLLIDGKEVVSAPGRHGPARWALRGSRKDVRLTAGPHQFDYYHVATGPEAIMAAAWEINPPDSKPAPQRIPGTAFRTGSIGRVEASGVELRTTRLVPDFLVSIAGDVPLPDNDVPLVAVHFRDNSPKALTLGSKPQWDFGDGQTGDQLNVDHVYLRPGVYTVKLTLKRGGRSVEMANRVEVDRPALTQKDQGKLPKLDDYLPVLKTYNPRTLDAASLRQLALCYEAKALAIEGEAKEGSGKEAGQWIAVAVAAGKVAFVEDSPAQNAEDLYRLAELIGPMARDRLGDSQLALGVWQGAVRKLSVDAWKARAATQAADVAVNDLLEAAAAKSLLDTATTASHGGQKGQAASELQRVWGDYYALTGNGPAARKAYQQAEQSLGSPRSFAERTAWRGAHSRSTEEFIRQRQSERAAAQLRLWQREFPAEKIDGYLTLLYARYFAGRKMYAQAVAQAEQLQAVNPASPYVDQLLLLAADCEVKRDRVDRALATLHALLKDYPGSPLIPEVKKNIARLEAEKSN
jgi:predicted negative regulator of RcsB-dependent stress response